MFVSPGASEDRKVLMCALVGDRLTTWLRSGPVAAMMRTR